MSGSAVAVVTDSTASLPEGMADKHHITVVPMSVTLDGGTPLGAADVSAAEVAERLRSRRSAPTTSRPAPGEFAAVYARLAAEGATDIVAVHLSGALSGTVESARLGAADAPVPVRVVDSRLTGMGLGFAVLAAAESAAAADDAAAVERAALAAAERTDMFFYVDTLEYLRRGGRVGRATAWMGTALSVKPLLHIHDGEIAPLEKVRTCSRALARLAELVVARAGADPVDVAVQHLAAGDRAEELAAALRGRLPGLRTLHVGEVGPAIGVHVGPGTVSVALSRLAGPPVRSLPA